MNYFAHGYRFVDRPYFLAGTAIPDLLSAVDRRVRARRKRAVAFVDDCDPVVADVAAGIVRHHDDDRWFHSQPAFVELSMNFAVELRSLLEDTRGTRTGFVGHILVELIMDALLIQDQPTFAKPYYRAVGTIDGALLERIVARISGSESVTLQKFLEMFLRVRFLEDYAEDEMLIHRINQVLKRVQLDPIDFQRIQEWLPTARNRVAARMHQLIPPLSLP